MSTADPPPDAEPPEPQLVPVSAPASPPPMMRARRPYRVRLASLLFIATCASTLFAGGAFMSRTGRFDWNSGLTYMAAVMGILLFHELGHFLQAVRHHVTASLPYFIPFPLTPIGTMGAVIVQGARRIEDRIVIDADRKQMFDIAVTGPLAGLVVAIPVLWFGVAQTEYHELPPFEEIHGGEPLVIYTDPPIMVWMANLQHGPRPENHELDLTPLVWAGWVGMLLTGLNLIPIGQLDGGHILYALVGKRAHLVSLGLLACGFGYSIWSGSYSYILLLVLLAFFGPRHPPTLNDSQPLGPLRHLIGWGTLALIFALFTPEPIRFIEGEVPKAKAVPVSPQPLAEIPADA